MDNHFLLCVLMRNVILNPFPVWNVINNINVLNWKYPKELKNFHKN